MADRYVDPGKIEALKNHRLTLLTEGVGFKMYRLGLPDTGDLAVRLTFTGAPFVEQITLSGDIHPGPCPHGCVSNMGYGIEWFGGNKSTEYLCSKFLPVVWVPEAALDRLRGLADSIKEDAAGSEGDEYTNCYRRLTAVNEAIEAASSQDFDDVTRSAEAFGEFYSEIEESHEDEGFTYDIRDGSWLIAIQRRFAECYQAMLAADTSSHVAAS